MAKALPVRPSNQTMVERIVQAVPGVTRGELSALLSLSPTTVNPLVAHAIERGRVTEEVGARGNGSVGRPQNGLRSGGPKLSFGLVVWSHGTLRSAVATFDGGVHWLGEVPVDRAAPVPMAEEVRRAAAGLMASTVADVDRPQVLVLSVPAPYQHGLRAPQDVRGRFSPLAAGRWFEQDPAAVLRADLKVPVVVENDSNLAALGEARAGAGRLARFMVYLRLSDRGIGSGLTIDGETVVGADGFAGEIAHARVDGGAMAVCTCGSRGCLRTELGPSLLDSLRPAYGSGLDYSQLLSLVAAGEPGPVRVLQDAGRAIAAPMAHIITFLNPSAVVVEAGSPSASETVMAGMRDFLSQSTPSFIRDSLNLRVAELGQDAVSIGALELARSRAIGDAEVGRRLRRMDLRFAAAL